MDYLEVNRAAYNTLAPEYNEKWLSYIRNQEKILKPFVTALGTEFSNRKAKVLDVGCGVGLNSYLLAKHGLHTTGLDFSENMLFFARQNSPKTKFILAEFLEWQTHEKFHGILAGAFLPLFLDRDRKAVIKKFARLLEDRGFGLVYFSLLDAAGLIPKNDYRKKVRRFRPYVTPEIMCREISTYFRIVDISLGYGNKKWVILLFQKI